MRNPLMWKLLRKHISKAQLIGFAIANMVGLTIVLLGLQFWQDVRPVFEDEDSFIRKDYLVVTKSIGTASMVKSMLGRNRGRRGAGRGIWYLSPRAV